jgi:hypothetical protein
MRVLVLLFAIVFSAGSLFNGASMQTAQGRMAVRSVGCGAVRDPLEKQNCMNSANVRYAVESQGELVEQQNAQQAEAYAQAQQQASTERDRARCDALARSMLRCQILTPDDVPRALGACHQMIASGGHAYGRILCYEAAVDCEGLRWCRVN